MFENLSRMVRTYIIITWGLAVFPKWGHGIIVQVKCNI